MRCLHRHNMLCCSARMARGGASPAAAAGLLLAALLPSMTMAQLPTLDEMSGSWIEVLEARDPPAISNTVGSVGTVNDLVDVSSFFVPPLVAAPTLLRMRIDGFTPVLAKTRWFAYAARRASRPHVSPNRPDTLGEQIVVTVQSEVRMAFADAAVLWEVDIDSVNSGDDETQSPWLPQDETKGQTLGPQQQQSDEDTHVVELSSSFFARQLASMGWIVEGVLMPQNRTDFITSTHTSSTPLCTGQCILAYTDTHSPAVSGMVVVGPDGGSWVHQTDKARFEAATMTLRVPKGQRSTIKIAALMSAEGVDGVRARLEALTEADGFGRVWRKAKEGWEGVWRAAFGQDLDGVVDAQQQQQKHQEVQQQQQTQSQPQQPQHRGLQAATTTTSHAITSTSGPAPGQTADDITAATAENPTTRSYGNTPSRTSPSPFSGRLPVLHTDDESVKRVYYMGALTLLTTYRAHMPSLANGPAYVTAHGNTCWRGRFHNEYPDAERVDGYRLTDCLMPEDPRKTELTAVGIGVTAEFYWDTALRSMLTALLDPRVLRSYILSALNLPPPGYKDNFGVDLLSGSPLGYSYSFNALSLFTMVSAYIRVTNDASILGEKVGVRGETVDHALESLALDWMRYPRTTNETSGAVKGYLADYGGNQNNFLECIPTYLHVIPGLNAGNVEMMSWMADLRQQEGNATGAQYFKTLAASTTVELIDRLYVKGGGYWRCKYLHEQKDVEVRSVVDLIYVARGLHAAGRGPGLPPQIGKEMSDFFSRELETEEWIRALSLDDALARATPIPGEIFRPDHGILGAYDAWMALSVEAMAVMDGGKWDKALSLLRKASIVTHEGPYGQAHEVTNSAKDGKAFKTKRGWTRYAADNGGSFSEVIVRGLFGYQPPFLPSATSTIQDALVQPDMPRGEFSGRLEGLTTPWGTVTMEVDGKGVRVVEGGKGTLLGRTGRQSRALRGKGRVNRKAKGSRRM